MKYLKQLKVKQLTSALVGLFSVAILSGCGEPSDQSLYKNSLIYCSEGSPITFNPQLTASNTTWDAVSNTLYNVLLSTNHKTAEFLPELATAWEVSEDGLVYTFELRRNVVFHTTEYFTPTRHFNADDVLFSFNRTLDIRHRYHDVGGGSYRKLLNDSVVNIKALNPYKVQFELNHPDSTFMDNLATDFSVILSKEYADQLYDTGVKEQIDKLPIGTGPYKFREYKRDELIRYYRHENYWKSGKVIPQLVFDITKNGASRIAKLLTHECDISAYPLPQELPLLEKRKDINVIKATVFNVGFWAFNTDKPPFDNILVRKALAHAINLDAIMDAVFYNQATKADSMLPPISWAYHRNEQPIHYNPHKAKQLLEQAGFHEGFSMTIWATPIQRDYNPNAYKTAELMQSDLAKIGVKAEIVTFEWATFRKRLDNGEHDSVIIGWSADNADPDNFLRSTLSCNAKSSGRNRAFWCNDKFDDLLSSARINSDTHTRKGIYRKAQAIINKQVPLFPIAHTHKFQAHLTNISGLVINPYGSISLAEARKE
jgi:cationic peptide transport system substrate-binding protein